MHHTSAPWRRVILPCLVSPLLAALGYLPARGEELPHEDLKAGNDAKKRYFLIGPSPKVTIGAEGYGLIVMIPGASQTGEDWLPKAKEYAQALPNERYLFAFPCSVIWNEKQTNPWPTAKTPEKGMKFCTEDFLEAVVADVKARHKVNVRRVFLYGYQWGAFPAYAAGLRPRSPFTGVIAATGEMKLKDLPAIAGARARGWYLMSWDDPNYCPKGAMEEARAALRKAGARVEFKDFGKEAFGGQGCAALLSAIEWLEKNAGEPPK
ncbi:MAG: hypothetical protein HYY18_12030 [Planctomycetes bacterium]|nr:hypothetical protein [Planctomycetota bacterium]